MFLNADFHSAEQVTRSTISARFAISTDLYNYSNSKESERKRSITQYFPLNNEIHHNLYRRG